MELARRVYAFSVTYHRRNSFFKTFFPLFRDTENLKRATILILCGSAYRCCRITRAAVTWKDGSWAKTLKSGPLTVAVRLGHVLPLSVLIAGDQREHVVRA